MMKAGIRFSDYRDTNYQMSNSLDNILYQFKLLLTSNTICIYSRKINHMSITCLYKTNPKGLKAKGYVNQYLELSVLLCQTRTSKECQYLDSRCLNHKTTNISCFESVNETDGGNVTSKIMECVRFMENVQRETHLFA